MNRNVQSRIEVCFPIKDTSLCKELAHILQLQLQDNQKAVMISSNLESGKANNMRVLSAGLEPVAAQEAIYGFVKGLKG